MAYFTALIFNFKYSSLITAIFQKQQKIQKSKMALSSLKAVYIPFLGNLTMHPKHFMNNSLAY